MNIKINMGQKTALGNDRSATTKYRIVKNYKSSNEDIGLLPYKETASYGAIEIGVATVLHPQVMWGNGNELDNDMRRAIMDEIENYPGVTSNDYGVLFAPSDDNGKPKG